MKTYSALIAIGGDLLNTVAKENLTVAEMALLMHVHGKGSLTRVHEQGEVEDVGHARLVAFLRAKWPRVNKLIPDVVEQYGRLPTEIEELELVPAQVQGEPVHLVPRVTEDTKAPATVEALPPMQQHDEPTNALGEDEGSVRDDDPFAPAPEDAVASG